MVEVIAELMACVDCVMWVANDDVPEERPNLPLLIGAWLGVRPNQHLAMGDAEKDDEFSWRACECCGSALGGGRSEIVLMECS